MHNSSEILKTIFDIEGTNRPEDGLHLLISDSDSRGN